MKRKRYASAEVCWPGQYGFLLLRYVGRSPEERIWRGPDTGAAYRFGPGDVRYVDKRDALKLLTIPGDYKVFVHDRDEVDQAEPVSR